MEDNKDIKGHSLKLSEFDKVSSASHPQKSESSNTDASNDIQESPSINDLQKPDEFFFEFDYQNADDTIEERYIDDSSFGSSNESLDSDTSSKTNEPTQELNNKRIILQRFTIYNSLKTMYIVGSNARENLFRILEIGKTGAGNGSELTILEDTNYFYTRKDMFELVNVMNETIEGGIHKIAYGCGLLGLIKFTEGYFLSLITKSSQIATLGGHHIYHIDETQLIPLDMNYEKPEKYSDEDKLLSIFKSLELGKTFYFSYTYDITNSLQTNFLRNKMLANDYKNRKILESDLKNFKFEHNDRFVWNKLLLKPALENYDGNIYEWFQPILHGFIDQANISIFGKSIYITIIARRSHHFAGARFLKRGMNDKGNVANEVETEQIVSDMLITSFHDPKYGFYNNPRFTSYVQHRGSIPLYWTQDLNKLPKPPIEINLSDPFYRSSSTHFNNLFKRYGSPIIILNLIKTKEKTPRESKLNSEYIKCLEYLNQFLPQEHKLQHHSFDMSRASKKNHDVITPLEEFAQTAIDKTGFFHNGTNLAGTKLQSGIIRTNCIDCLDRTNAAQFIICKNALGYQLNSLGLIPTTSLDYDSDLINILTEIFHDHGDTIALQYGGSNLVNTMDSYRRINQWSSHTRDYLNSIKRIYSNSFMDSLRQEAINLFLGNYIYEPNKPKLWELENDFYLHNDISIKNIRVKTSYIRWFNEKYLTDRHNLLLENERLGQEKDDDSKNMATDIRELLFETVEPYPNYNDNWFNECYVPRKFSSLNELFQFNMNSNSRYFPQIVDSNKTFDYSPFESRRPELRGSPNKVNSINNEKILNYKKSTITNDSLSTLNHSINMDDVKDASDKTLSSPSVLGPTITTLSAAAVMDASTTTTSAVVSSSKLSGTEFDYSDDSEDDNEDYEELGSNTLNFNLQSSQKKIKDFLTTKIEKLGYSGFPKKEVTPKLDEPEFDNPNESIDQMKDGIIYSKPKISEKDLRLYENTINLITELPESMKLLPKKKSKLQGIQEIKVPTVKPQDLKLYKFSSIDNESNNKYYEDLDLKDLKIYNEYFNNESDIMNIYRNDNYFK